MSWKRLKQEKKKKPTHTCTERRNLKKTDSAEKQFKTTITTTHKHYHDYTQWYTTEQIHRQKYRIRTKHYIRKGTFRNQKGIFRFRNMRAKKSRKIELNI